MSIQSYVEKIGRPRITVFLVLSFITRVVFERKEFVVHVGIRCRWNFNADSDGFKMHAKMKYGANNDYERCLAHGFVMYLAFVRIKFIVPVGTRCGRKFNIDSDGFEMHAQMSWGAHEVHAGCFVFDSVLGPIFIRVEFIVPIETVVDKSSPATHTDSKCMHK